MQYFLTQVSKEELTQVVILNKNRAKINWKKNAEIVPKTQKLIILYNVSPFKSLKNELKNYLKSKISKTIEN